MTRFWFSKSQAIPKLNIFIINSDNNSEYNPMQRQIGLNLKYNSIVQFGLYLHTFPCTVYTNWYNVFRIRALINEWTRFTKINERT